MPITYETTAHGKIILAGEHAVLRGSPALVLPFMSKQLKLKYEANNDAITAECEGSDSELVLTSFWRTLEHGLKLINKSKNEVKGFFSLQNNINVAAGMGFSSALCVTIARWFEWKEWIPPNSLFEFSRLLENLFHDSSSGVDIVGAMSEGIMLFKMGENPVAIEATWQPKLYLTYLKTRSMTAICVKEVEKLWRKNPSVAKRLDEDMARSVEHAKLALQMSGETGLPLLKKSINVAQQCFLNWNLINYEMDEHIRLLQKEGAIAVKPTGSGLGGYILSLWEKDPCLDKLSDYLPISIRM